MSWRPWEPAAPRCQTGAVARRAMPSIGVVPRVGSHKTDGDRDRARRDVLVLSHRLLASPACAGASTCRFAGSRGSGSRRRCRAGHRNTGGPPTPDHLPGHRPPARGTAGRRGLRRQSERGRRRAGRCRGGPGRGSGAATRRRPGTLSAARRARGPDDASRGATDRRIGRHSLDAMRSGPSPKRTSVPARSDTDDDTISASVRRKRPVICVRSGPVSPSTRTGTLVTYSLRIT